VTFRFRVEPLDKQHDRKAFTCGVAALDEYIRARASQDIKRLVATCFVAVDNATGAVAGYYTLSAGSVPLADLPAVTAKKLPRYPVVPAVRIGRLAVALGFQGQDLGRALLADAAIRVLGSDIGAFAVMVDAKDEEGVGFYARHGFIRLDKTLSLFLPLDTLRAAGEKPR
jgi:GNAT superfamily N-acetyltransferase